MSGLLALLDDVAALAKLAAASIDDVAAQAVQASKTAAGVVIDDAAVTPRYVTGLSASRELSIIGRIAVGSLRNKIIVLLPAALGLSIFLPWAVTPLLVLGGLYLCYEGFEKVLHLLSPPAHADDRLPLGVRTDAKALEDEKVSSAIRTDFILSAEIMAISLASITSPDLVTKAAILAVVGLLVTIGVYGVVALIVRADDFGVWLVGRGGALAPVGRLLVTGMARFLEVLGFIGMLAMLWVGGGILIHGLAEFGITEPEHAVHAVADAAQSLVPEMGAILAWLAGASVAAVLGVIAGGLVAVMLAPVKALKSG